MCRNRLLIFIINILAYNGIVHGDLACRNVLIFRFDPIEPKKNLVKLTDFGLSRFSKIYSSVIGSVSTTTIHVSVFSLLN
jgi:serine/threonine protein kinase